MTTQQPSAGQYTPPPTAATASPEKVLADLEAQATRVGVARLRTSPMTVLEIKRVASRFVYVRWWGISWLTLNGRHAALRIIEEGRNWA